MVARFLIVAALVAGCEKRSELYCEKNPEDLAHCPPTDAPDVPVTMCTDNASCTTSKPFCEMGSHVCVACLTNADCTDADKPNCDPMSFTCRGCLEHSDCASDACLPATGLCGDDSKVIYVDAQNGLNANDGTHAKPLATITEALKLVTATRLYIKLTGTLTESLNIDGKNVVILADPDAKLVGVSDPAVKIKGGTVKIFDLEIECPATPAIRGVSVEGMGSGTLDHVYIHGCGKMAIDATEKFLALSRSRIESNADGIVTTNKVDFVITNNFIVRNGSVTAAHGGVELGATAATNRFEFNTVAHNVAANNLLHAGGITCPVTLDTLTIPNNLIIGNMGGDGNVSGGCTTTASLVDADDTPYGFKSSTSAPYDYHLMPPSLAIDMASTPTVVTDDIDGELRPQGAQRDFGADEYRP
jgi:hypothetical protein